MEARLRELNNKAETQARDTGSRISSSLTPAELKERNNIIAKLRRKKEQIPKNKIKSNQMKYRQSNKQNKK